MVFDRHQISFIEEFENSKSPTFVLAVPHSTLLKLVCRTARFSMPKNGIGFEGSANLKA
jgi:hypothetical protein